MENASNNYTFLEYLELHQQILGKNCIAKERGLKYVGK